jgi:hypothetical protein
MTRSCMRKGRVLEICLTRSYKAKVPSSMCRAASTLGSLGKSMRSSLLDNTMSIQRARMRSSLSQVMMNTKKTTTARPKTMIMTTTTTRATPQSLKTVMGMGPMGMGPFWPLPTWLSTLTPCLTRQSNTFL